MSVALKSKNSEPREFSQAYQNFVKETIEKIKDEVLKKKRPPCVKHCEYGGVCLYRHPKKKFLGEPNRCWIGLLIPDEKYHSELEGRTADELFDDTLMSLEDIEPELENITSQVERDTIVGFLSDLQSIHDDLCGMNPKEFRDNAKEILKELEGKYLFV